MALPDEETVRRLLGERGAAEHVIQGGAAGLIQAWRKVVEDVERGYRFGLDDYRNDLDIRSLIDAAGLGPAVAAEDARFRRMLTGAKHPVWSSDAPDAFWVEGYPSNASGELLDGLRSESLI
ncbi:MAG: hypothetical protein KGN84_19550 [Acidobacteriota bacterium]|nr:hypothetical protein [Acidobacteriota bacterium]